MSYTPPPPPDPSAYGVPQTGARPGALLDRFLARLIDGFIVVFAYMTFGVFLIGGVLLSSVSSDYLAGVILVIFFVALQLGYYVFMETTRGQTVGKILMKLRVLGANGANPTAEESLRRNSFMAIGLIAIVPVIGLLSSVASIVAYVMIAVGINSDTVNRQAWHDKFAGGTRVIKEG